MLGAIRNFFDHSPSDMEMELAPYPNHDLGDALHPHSNEGPFDQASLLDPEDDTRKHNADVNSEVSSLLYPNEGPSVQPSILGTEEGTRKQKENVNLEVSSLLGDSRSNTSISPSKRRLLLMDWKWEILASFLAYATMIALVFILRQYADSDKTKKAWKDVSLNTIVALLATVIRVSCMFPVGVSLLQAGITSARRGANGKWSGQRLRDLDTFHSASRGVMGSLKMIFLVKP